MVGPANLVLMIDGQPSNVSGLTLSADVFAALGVRPALGRAYTVDEDFGGRQHGDRVVARVLAESARRA